MASKEDIKEEEVNEEVEEETAENGDAEGEEEPMNEDEGNEEANEEEMEEEKEDGDEEKNEGDEGEEGGEKKKKKKDGVFVPSKLDFKQDRLHQQHMCTVLIGPATLDDLINEKLYQQAKESYQFFIRFHKDSSASFKGHIEMRFETETEAQAAEEAFKDLREGLTAKQITPEFVKEDSYKELTKLDSELGKREMKTVAVPGLPSTVTVEQLKENFPDTVQIWIPKSENGESKGYAYLEYPDVETVDKHIGTEAEIEGVKVKVTRLDYVPSTLGALLKQMDKENIKAPLDRAMNEQKVARYQKMIKVASHYHDQPDMPDKKKNLLAMKIGTMRRRLREHSRLSAKRGKGMRGGGRGGRGGGGRGGNTPRGRRDQGNGGRGGRGGMGSPRGGGFRNNMGGGFGGGNWNRGGGFGGNYGGNRNFGGNMGGGNMGPWYDGGNDFGGGYGGNFGGNRGFGGGNWNNDGWNNNGWGGGYGDGGNQGNKRRRTDSGGGNFRNRNSGGASGGGGGGRGGGRGRGRGRGGRGQKQRY